MADQGVWFKLWLSADDDPDIGNLSLEDFARWCKLGMYIKKHGTGGAVDLKPPCIPLQQKFRVQSFDDVLHVISMFPNCAVTGVTNPTVTWGNWHKYQGDNSVDRVRKFRQRVTAKKRRDEIRRDEKRKEDKEEDNTSHPKPDEQVDKWPSPFLLIELYNTIACDDFSSVEKITEGRIKKARAYLRQFPEESFWREVFDEMNKSAFLRGHVKANGHESFRANFDWLLMKGKDGTENVAKVYEGKYRNGAR